MKTVCLQNDFPHAVKYENKVVYPLYIYGSACGYRFICKPVENELPLATKDGENWFRCNDKRLCGMIRNAAKRNEIVLFSASEWTDRMKQVNLSKEATHAFFDENPVRKRHVKVSGRKLPQMSTEYEAAGQVVYGKTLEMNGKCGRVKKAMVQYMDGNGSGLRPLDTGVFIGSGRKVRFAKAPL